MNLGAVEAEVNGFGCEGLTIHQHVFKFVQPSQPDVAVAIHGDHVSAAIDPAAGSGVEQAAVACHVGVATGNLGDVFWAVLAPDGEGRDKGCEGKTSEFHKGHFSKVKFRQLLHAA